MMATKKKKIRMKGGRWVQSLRCMNCNSTTLLKNYGIDRKKWENKGKMKDENGKPVDCNWLCDKGFFNSSGSIST